MLFNDDSPGSLSDGLSLLPEFASNICKSSETFKIFTRLGVFYICCHLVTLLISNVGACLDLAMPKIFNDYGLL